MATIEIKEDRDDVRVEIAGDLVASTYEAFDQAIRAFDVGDRRLILDLSRVPAIDSCGLGMLLLARDRARSGSVRITGTSEALRRLLDVVSFGQLFQIE